MTLSASTSSTSVSLLQRQVRTQQEEIARLHHLIEKKEPQWEATRGTLFEQFRLAIERRFAPSPEKYRVEQEIYSSTKPKWPWMRRTLPSERPRVEVIGQDVSEELHVVPALVEVIRHVRLKYGCPACEEGVQITPVPAKLLPRSNASAPLLACVATTAKYQNALPLYRQSQIFPPARRRDPALYPGPLDGADGRAIGATGRGPAPHLLQSPLIHMDETTLQINTELAQATTGGLLDRLRT